MIEQDTSQNVVTATPVTSSRKRNILIFCSVLVALILIAGAILVLTQDSKDPEPETKDQTSQEMLTSIPTSVAREVEEEVVPTTKLFKSEIGGFSIELPIEIVMTESEESMEDEYTRGEINFTFGPRVKVAEGQISQGQLVIPYSKPEVIGKGGACPGGTSYTGEIAGQSVWICENETYFSASYFKHPTQQIEYIVSISNLSAEQTAILKQAVIETLKFE